MKKMLVLTLLCLVVTLSGCNTINGAGKDLEKAGQAVEKSTK